MWHDLHRFERSPVQTAPRNSFTSFWKISVPTIGCWTADNCLQIDSEVASYPVSTRSRLTSTDFDWLDIFSSVLVASMRITNGVPRFQGQKFHYPRVCPGDQPLTKSWRNSGLEIGLLCDAWCGVRLGRERSTRKKSKMAAKGGVGDKQLIRSLDEDLSDESCEVSHWWKKPKLPR